MSAVARRIAGVFVLAIGLWVAVNVVITVLGRGALLLGSIVLAALFIFVGLFWVRGRQAG